jgi:hypothetical protein
LTSPLCWGALYLKKKEASTTSVHILAKGCACPQLNDYTVNLWEQHAVLTANVRRIVFSKQTCDLPVCIPESLIHLPGSVTQECDKDMQSQTTGVSTLACGIELCGNTWPCRPGFYLKGLPGLLHLCSIQGWAYRTWLIWLRGHQFETLWLIWALSFCYL